MRDRLTRLIRHNYPNWLAIAVLALVSLGATNQYDFGESDHAIVVPMLKESLDPGLYPGDYLLEGGGRLYTLLWPGMRWLVAATPLGIPSAFFLGYCLALWLAFLAFYRLSLRLFGVPEAALLGLFFLLAPDEVLGGVDALDSLFYTRTAALPCLLWAFYHFLSGRLRLSFFLLGCGFLLHPLSASYAIAMVGLAALADWRGQGPARLAQALALLGLTISPLIAWKLLTGGSDVPLGRPDPEWLRIMRLRSAHHLFPSNWAPMLYVQGLLVVAVFLLGWRQVRESATRRALTAFGLAIAGLCLAGLVFSELLPLGLALQFQFFRSFRWLLWLAPLLYTPWALERVGQGRRAALTATAPGVALLLASAEWEYALVGSLLWTGYLLLRAGGWLEGGRRRRWALALAPALLLGIFGSHQNDWEPPRLEGDRGDEWEAVQAWARSHTPRDAAFIVPPEDKGFRIGAERTVYAEWKDGTQAFFSVATGREWMRRMQRLELLVEPDGDPVFEAYDHMRETDFIQLADELRSRGAGSVYVVVEDQRLGWPLVWENEDYRVYKVPAAGQNA